VVDTGLVPRQEGGEDPWSVDAWGILTPSRNREEATVPRPPSTPRPGRRTVELLETPVKEGLALEVSGKENKLPLTPIKMVSSKNSR
jgi:hypothetical protein